MNYTKKYKQVSKGAARTKYTRMAASMKMSGANSSFECGFSTWWWGKDIPKDEFGYPLMDGKDCEDYAIFVSTNYHSEPTIDRMYKTNCKDW